MDISATRDQDHEMGLTTNERRMKSYTVGIPKLISFDINVAVNRKSDKRQPRIQNTPTPYDDPSLMKTPPTYKKMPIVDPPSSGSDDLMHSANNATTHSDSIEMVDHEEKLKELPSMLQKLASLNINETKTKPTGFVRSPEISPRKRGSERASNRRTTGRMTPILGSNRMTTRTAPTSPLISPHTSPRSSMITSDPITIPNEIKLDEVMPHSYASPISLIPPKKAPSVNLPAMRHPRQSLYDSNIARRPRAGMPSADVLAKQISQQGGGNDTLAHSTSSSSINERATLKRTTTQYNRDIDGFIQELSDMQSLGDQSSESKEKKEKEKEEVASFGETDESTMLNDEEKEMKEEEDEGEKMALKKVTLYRVLNAGDLMPVDHINHESVALYDNGVVNWRLRCYEFDVPETNFCFHCDKDLTYSHFNRHLCLTDHRHDILYGVIRCRVIRDINLCSECYHTNDLSRVIKITPKAKKLFAPIYPGSQ